MKKSTVVFLGFLLFATFVSAQVRPLYRIFNVVFHLFSVDAGFTSAESTQSFIKEYDAAWKSLEALPAQYPNECPSLFSKTTVRRTTPIHADAKINEMRRK